MRILVSTVGSAGDLFPLMPLVHELRRDGHDVYCAVPRGISLYLRLEGISPLALGDGTELDVMNDQSVLTTRFQGWVSWKRFLDGYVATCLQKDVDRLDGFVSERSPDLVITSGFAAAARIVAKRHSLPRFEASIYPQLRCLASHGRAFARRFRWAVDRVVADGAALDMPDILGAKPDVLLHDPLLLPSAEVPTVGYPYWDQAGGDSADLADAIRRLASGRPHILVTLGSFIGLAQRRAWEAAADAVRRLGVQATFVGVRDRWAKEALRDRGDIECFSYLPLSQLLPHADAVIHHGGLGTTFAALHAGCPAVIVPQAFDQPHNATLVSALGAGISATDDEIKEATRTVLSRRGYRERAQEAGESLVPKDVAVANLKRAALGVSHG